MQNANLKLQCQRRMWDVWCLEQQLQQRRRLHIKGFKCQILLVEFRSEVFHLYFIIIELIRSDERPKQYTYCIWVVMVIVLRLFFNLLFDAAHVAVRAATTDTRINGRYFGAIVSPCSRHRTPNSQGTAGTLPPTTDARPPVVKLKMRFWLWI